MNPRIEALRAVGAWAEDQAGRMPGYGQIFFANPGEPGEDYRVWYVGGDGDEDSFVKECKVRLGKVPDVEVRYEAEAFPPEDGRWTQVWPAESETKRKALDSTSVDLLKRMLGSGRIDKEDYDELYKLGSLSRIVQVLVAAGKLSKKEAGDLVAGRVDKAVIAVDLHGTIGAKKPGNGGSSYDPAGYTPQDGAAEKLRRWQKLGHEIVVWTCWDTDEAKDWLDRYRIPYDKVNEEGPNHGSPKVDADAYIDDKAIRHEGDWAETARRLEESGALEKSMTVRIRQKARSFDVGDVVTAGKELFRTSGFTRGGGSLQERFAKPGQKLTVTRVLPNGIVYVSNGAAEQWFPPGAFREWSKEKCSQGPNAGKPGPCPKPGAAAGAKPEDAKAGYDKARVEYRALFEKVNSGKGTDKDMQDLHKAEARMVAAYDKYKQAAAKQGQGQGQAQGDAGDAGWSKYNPNKALPDAARPPLTKPMVSALKKYSGSAYYDLNNDLRSCK